MWSWSFHLVTVLHLCFVFSWQSLNFFPIEIKIFCVRSNKSNLKSAAAMMLKWDTNGVDVKIRNKRIDLHLHNLLIKSRPSFPHHTFLKKERKNHHQCTAKPSPDCSIIKHTLILSSQFKEGLYSIIKAGQEKAIQCCGSYFFRNVQSKMLTTAKTFCGDDLVIQGQLLLFKQLCLF